MGFSRQARLAAGVAVAAFLTSSALAQIRTDASLGRAGQSLAGPQFTIPETLGSLRGSNLFHSFSAFSIATGESATFTTTTRGLGNVVSRVTGGDPSLINGALRLQSADGAPGFFFINPAGVTFGAGASIDVPGAFHVSTADYVKFPDGVFHANPNAQSALSSAPPEAFGFLGTQRSAVEVVNGARLATASLQAFSIVAGDVTMDNGRATTRGGDIRVVALGGGAREIGFTGTLPEASGSLRIVNGAQVSSPAASGADSGSVAISAANITIDRGASSGVTGIVSQANTGTTGNAGVVDVRASGHLEVLDGGVISSSTFTPANGGAVTVYAQTLTIDSRGNASTTGIFSNANPGSTGNAGRVDVHVAGVLSVLNGGEIGTNVFASARDAGSVTVNAASILIDRRGSATATGIFSTAASGSTGNAGTVDVTASGELVVLNGATISSSTFAAGNAGRVSVGAANVTLDGQRNGVSSSIASSANPGSTGNAGTVNVLAGNLVVRNGAEIASNTSSVGSAGSLRVQADAITIDGGDYGYGAIVSNARRDSTGNAGTVEVTSRGPLAIINGGGITSSTFSSGAAGTVRVQAADVTIDGRNAPDSSTSISTEASEGTGRAGNVEVSATGALTILANGVISSSTFSAGNAGSVNVTAGRIHIDATGAGDVATGITSSAYDGTGNAGPVRIATPGSVDVVSGGEISSITLTSGKAGTINIEAGSMSLDSRAGIFGHSRGSGDAGSVQVNVAGALSIADEGLISSSTFSSGHAGSVRVDASDITIVGRSDSVFATGIISQAEQDSSGNAGVVEVNARQSLSISNRGLITSSTFSQGDAGLVRVTARSLTIDGGGENIGLTGIASQAEPFSSGQAGSVTVSVAQDLSIRAGGAITSSTFSTGNGGAVRVDADDILLGGADSFLDSGIFSRAYSGSLGNAGNVDVTARRSLSLVNGGSISSDTFAEGNAGSVTVDAARALIDGRGFVAGITSEAHGGNAGSIDLRVAGDLTLLDGGQVATSTFSDGNAGAIRIVAGNIAIRNDPEVFSGLDSTGVFSVAQYDTGGNAGTIDITAAGTLSLIGGGMIDSTTRSFGRGGSVRVRAQDIEIDGASSFRNTGIYSRAEFGEGGAGSIDVTATRSLVINDGGLITSDTFALGNAGSVKVNAPSITIVGSEEALLTGISSRSTYGSAGNAGTVDVVASESLRVMSGGQITSSTSSIAEAGSVTVQAGSILVDGSLGPGGNSSITARALDTSRGQTGNVTVRASDITLSNGGELSITNEGRSSGTAARPTLLLVAAPVIVLVNGGSITAASSFDVSASNIEVDVGSRMTLINSSITTSAVDGNGGSITVTGDGVLALRDSQITTSVSGLRGNGGDISIGTRGLVMDTGFIQANTAASDAAGGNVNIDTEFLVPSGNTLFVGGQTPLEFLPGAFGLNVIQAAAPTGLSGTISITTPALDVSGGLVGLNAKVLDSGGLGRSLCEMTGGSSLALAGRGGMPRSARDFMRAEAVTPARTVALAALGNETLSRFACWR